MPIDIVIGGQAGDEGKGKISEYLNHKKNYEIVIRVSKPQAGHSIMYDGKKIGLVTLPCGFSNPYSRILIGAGAFISPEKLKKELEETHLDPNRLGIDHYSTIVTPKHLEEENENSNLMKKIGSVGTGAGPATRDKVMRKKNILFAKDIPELKPFLTDTKKEMYNALSKNKQILLECDQGFKLSLIHGEYPFVTSDDTTASTFLGKAGIGPKAVRDVYVVFKPYTTRVATGPLENEIDDKEKKEWAKTIGGEVGSVSKRVRRLGEFEWENAKTAILINSANKICLTHMDYFGIEKNKEFPLKAKTFLEKFSNKILKNYPNPEISLLSFGPNLEDVIEMESK